MLLGSVLGVGAGGMVLGGCWERWWGAVLGVVLGTVVGVVLGAVLETLEK